MDINVGQVIQDFLTLIAILNPFGNVPLFMSMTESLDKPVRRKLFRTIAIAGFFIMLIFGLVGDFLMVNLYKIEMKDLRVGGGLLLSGLAFKNLLFPPRVKKNKETSVEEEIKKGVVPMAFPMMVGPGSLAAMLIIKAHSGMVSSSLSLVITFVIIGLILSVGTYIEKVLGKLVLFILSRVMQVFIMAIGVRIFFTGLFEIIKAYK